MKPEQGFNLQEHRAISAELKRASVSLLLIESAIQARYGKSHRLAREVRKLFRCVEGSLRYHLDNDLHARHYKENRSEIKGIYYGGYSEFWPAGVDEFEFRTTVGEQWLALKTGGDR